MKKLSLSTDQQRVINSLLDWVGGGFSPLYLTVGGYAGTGKTTLIAVFKHFLANSTTKKKFKVLFGAYTGKAARVLEMKLNDLGVLTNDDYVGTIHSLIYKPMLNDREEIVGWERRSAIDCDLLIVDEASMIDEYIWNDLMSYGVPILAVGDHGQLPPIKGSFNLMQDPDLRLEKIHRQAQGNPIIELSIKARRGEVIEPGVYGDLIEKIDRRSDESRDKITDLLQSYNDETLILCGFNKTRVELNKAVRRYRGFETELPEGSDRVICLRNNHMVGIFNGMLGTIKTINDYDEDWFLVEADLDYSQSKYRGLMAKSQFGSEKGMNFTDQRRLYSKGDLFDFGYALTVHKAQGSQAKRVVLFEERFSSMEDEMWKRWLYTGITRAEKELYLIG